MLDSAKRSSLHTPRPRQSRSVFEIPPNPLMKRYFTKTAIQSSNQAPSRGSVPTGPWGHLALLLIDLQPQPSRDESRYALHHALSRPLRPDVDVAVIRISAEPVASALQLLVEFVEGDVRQEGRQRASLRSSFLPTPAYAVLHESGLEEREDEAQNAPVPDVPNPQTAKQLNMRILPQKQSYPQGSVPTKPPRPAMTSRMSLTM